MLYKLTPAEAAHNILSTVRVLPPEAVPLADALGRVLADAITSPIDLPHWDNAAMDGYAVRSSDVLGCCPVKLVVVDRIAAGAVPTKVVGFGQCSRIFTGAPIPEGSDSVIRQEDTSELEAGAIQIDDDRDAKQNVRQRGEDIQRGSLVLVAGTQLGAAQIGVLASFATEQVRVHRKPLVGILATGNELADLSERQAILDGRKIASSNSYTLAAMVKATGGVAVDLGIGQDEPQDLRDRLDAVREVDLLVTSGGVSVGEHDYLRQVVEEQGGEMRFWRVRMRPGGPIAFGLLRGKPWIGLPGNPVSTMVTFELFVRPVIRTMLGHDHPFRRTVPVRMGERTSLRAPLHHFLRAVVEQVNGHLVARLTGGQGSGILTSMAKANALILVPEDHLDVREGDTLHAMFLEEPVHVTRFPGE
jgi:molybdopterin molybdotransferase